MGELQQRCRDMGAQIIPTGSNNWAVAFGPGREAHQTFQVDSSGNISGLHTTVNLLNGKSARL